MKVIVKLCGEYIATAFMTSSEIHNAEIAGFTILRKEAKHE